MDCKPYNGWNCGTYLVNYAQKECIDREDSFISRNSHTVWPIQKMAHTEVNFINLTTLDLIEDFRRKEILLGTVYSCLSLSFRLK